MKMGSAAPHERAVLKLARRRGLAPLARRRRARNTYGRPDPPGARGEARANRSRHLYAGWSTRQRPSLVGRGVAASAARRHLPALRPARSRNRNAGTVRGLAGACRLASCHHGSPPPRSAWSACRQRSLTAGVDTIKVDGVSVPVFNAAKTIADCFKFRNKIGLDVALEALRDGWREPQGQTSMTSGNTAPC